MGVGCVSTNRDIEWSSSRNLRKTTGVAESLDWAATLTGLGVSDLGAALIAMLKTREGRARVTLEVTAGLAGRAA